jgi:hypothetical protein
MKTPARKPAFQKLSDRLGYSRRSLSRGSILTLAVLNIIMVVVPAVPAVFRADVMAVNPMMSVRHVARDPKHFIVAGPIARAMVVVWPVANLDLNPLGSNSGRKKETRRNNGDEQKFVFDHYPADHAPTPLANTSLDSGSCFLSMAFGHVCEQSDHHIGYGLAGTSSRRKTSRRYCLKVSPRARYHCFCDSAENNHRSVPVGPLDARSVVMLDGERRLAGEERWMLRRAIIGNGAVLRARFGGLQNR